MNDNLASNALAFLTLALALLVAVCGVLLAVPLGPSLQAAGVADPAVLFGLLGGLVGLGVGTIVSKALNRYSNSQCPCPMEGGRRTIYPHPPIALPPPRPAAPAPRAPAPRAPASPAPHPPPRSGIAMVFVCLAESPDALRAHRPEAHEALAAAWAAIDPTAAWAHGAAAGLA